MISINNGLNQQYPTFPYQFHKLYTFWEFYNQLSSYNCLWKIGDVRLMYCSIKPNKKAFKNSQSTIFSLTTSICTKEYVASISLQKFSFTKVSDVVEQSLWCCKVDRAEQPSVMLQSRQSKAALCDVAEQQLITAL